jgi:FkbM family methyltransferase
MGEGHPPHDDLILSDLRYASLVAEPAVTGTAARICRVLRLIPPNIPGKRRVARALLDGRLEPGEARVRDRMGLSYRVPDLREPVAFSLLVDGVYEPDVLSFLLEHLPGDGTFVDVGANIGVFALPAAKEVGGRGRVIAIEASNTVFDCLRANAALNGLSHVTALHVAACDAEGDVRFYPAPPDRFGMGALAPQFHAAPVDVPGARLDRLLAVANVSHVDIVKVDVEGFEVKVFEGAVQLLASAPPPIIVFEFCDWAERRMPGGKPGDAQRFLMAHGYSVWTLADYRRGREPLEAPVTTGETMLVAERRRSS